MTKKEIRELIRERKRQHTTEQLQSYSQSIKGALLERITKEENCQTILLYHSLPDEVNTHDLIRILYAQGYTILLPTVVGCNLTLHVYEGEDTMNIGLAYGIQESLGKLFTEYSHIDLAIIPGMAFPGTISNLLKFLLIPDKGFILGIFIFVLTLLFVSLLILV